MSTTGRFPDPDGYTVAIDGGAAQPVGSNDQLTFTGLAAGDHVVQLSGISRKCAVSGSNPVTITVPAGGTATAAFFLGCPFPKGERS
jgi:hypothetical protein